MDYARDYGQDQELVKQFFRDFTYVDENGEILTKYGPKLTQIANRETVHLVVELADVEKFNQDLVLQIMGNTCRYTQIFYAALDEILPAYKTKEPDDKDPMDVFIEQRLFVTQRNQARAGGPQETNGGSSSQAATDPVTRFGGNGGGQYPPDLIRRAEITFKPADLQSIPIRQVRAEHIGHLVTVRGIVTRVTDVKPRTTIVCYTCDQCGCETFQSVKGHVYTPLFECVSAPCKSNKVIGRLTTQVRGSKFVKHQEIKLQEHSDQVPTGHIPRTITIEVQGELTRKCTPGDHISLSGVFLTIEKTSFRQRTGGLAADTYLEAHYICQLNKTEDDELSIEPMTEEEAAEFTKDASNFLGRLSNSIAPEIYGHSELKKALLLLLVGGVDKNADGMKIRGNINICIMGDPGVAKSQLLSFIDRMASRSQYTTGRGSSGVGLTAAVLKDPITNELVLEGGALVLADNGICCIDEFDKMMDADRTAIHEVMEQQTVSIAKAGIMTTLNARVSILAAANPAYGRYNVHSSITDNLQLPQALLSRFDLLWLIRDQPNKESDTDLASHITWVHMNPNDDKEHAEDAIDMKIMRRYINLCKQKQPLIPHQLDDVLLKMYLDIRQKKRLSEKGLEHGADEGLFTSPRTLLAIIRLSTAYARLRLSEIVEEPDIHAAMELYNHSRSSIEGISLSGLSTEEQIMDLISSLVQLKRSPTISMIDIMLEAEKLNFEESKVRHVLKKLAEFETIELGRESVTLIR